MRPLLRLLEHGQSYWLDNLTREKLESGELERRVAEEGLRGVTSNPAIFHKAITRSTHYDDDIAEMVERCLPVSEIYEELVVSDIRRACDVLRPVYDESEGRDGYVSLEVSPYLAHDTEGTIEEACRLRDAVDRPNVFIKIPGTAAGVPAIEECLARGVNINVTLLFSIESYEAVAKAYLRALERRLDEGEPVDNVASVASFFLSRIDVLVDQILGHRIRPRRGDDPAPAALLGRAAVANARLAYARFLEIFSGERWERLAGEGARVQRMLWASTSTKDPLYSDVRYVEPLIGPDTVNTMPERTISAFADHGSVAETVQDDLEESRRIMRLLEDVGVDFAQVTRQLENEGVQKFIDPYDRLMGKLGARCGPRGEAGDAVSQVVAAGPVEGDVDDALESLRTRQFVRRLFARDASLFSDDADEQAAIGHRLGWLDAPGAFRTRTREILDFADGVRPPEFTHVVVLGMGGSSEWARACSEIFGPDDASDGARPRLLVLDDTAPAAVREVEERVELDRTLFVVASKSGSTVETLSFYRHFRERVGRKLDAAPGDRFVAVTDPDSPLAREAREEGFRRVFENPEDVGGRYSALTWFGLVPMALLGVDLEAVLGSAERMLRRSEGPVPPADNPAVRLGTVLGLLARSGRDKVTLSFSDSLAPFGGWLRQLLAESTGKDGVGLIPVLGESPLEPGSYGSDRVFVHLRTAGSQDLEQTRRLEALEDTGHPVIRVQIEEPEDLGAEVVRWEVATATAGAVLGVNPFDEPNVAEAKRNTAELLEGAEAAADSVVSSGALTLHVPARRDGDGADPSDDGRAPPDVADGIEEFLGRVPEGGYLAVLPFLRTTPERAEALARLREQLRQRVGAATCLQHGPRYLHSTGQLHKGGPAKGAFLLLTADEGEDLPVPGRPYSFAELQRAQAEGDLRALADRGRPVVRVDLGPDPEAGLRELSSLIPGVAREPTAAASPATSSSPR